MCEDTLLPQPYPQTGKYNLTGPGQSYQSYPGNRHFDSPERIRGRGGGVCGSFSDACNAAPQNSVCLRGNPTEFVPPLQIPEGAFPGSGLPSAMPGHPVPAPLVTYENIPGYLRVYIGETIRVDILQSPESTAL